MSRKPFFFTVLLPAQNIQAWSLGEQLRSQASVESRRMVFEGRRDRQSRKAAKIQRGLQLMGKRGLGVLT